MSKKLVAFYSRADENYVSGMLKNLDIGNTEVLACMIKELTGADVFKIEQEIPYSKRYNECVEEAREDQRKDARPKLKKNLESIDKYDVIYVGYPNYWNTMPMAVFTFLESFDFAGKVIKPFCTHEGSGMGSSAKDIKKLCPNAKVESGFNVYGSRVNSAKKDLEKWV